MKIGFIGLGIMGRPMAKNLMKAGHQVYAYDVTAENIKDVASAGAVPCASVGEVAANTSCIILMVPDSPQVREVVTGEGGLLATAKAGTLVIDMSSIAPLVSQEMAELLKEKSIRFMDAPVSGGEPKAIDGTLAIMVGSTPEDFTEAEPILLAMGASAVRTGDVGSGNVTKLANNIIVALNTAAIAEAFTLAAKAGVDPELVFKAIQGGLAGSAALNQKAPMILGRNLNPGFKIDLHFKDLNNALETAKGIGLPLFLTPQVHQIMQAVRQAGDGQLDSCAMITFYEKLANQEVGKK